MIIYVCICRFPNLTSWENNFTVHDAYPAPLLFLHSWILGKHGMVQDMFWDQELKQKNKCFSIQVLQEALNLDLKKKKGFCSVTLKIRTPFVFWRIVLSTWVLRRILWQRKESWRVWLKILTGCILKAAKDRLNVGFMSHLDFYLQNTNSARVSVLSTVSSYVSACFQGPLMPFSDTRTGQQ